MRTAKALFDNLCHLGFKPGGYDDSADLPVVFFPNGLQIEISPDDLFVIIEPGAPAHDASSEEPERFARLADLVAVLADKVPPNSAAADTEATT